MSIPAKALQAQVASGKPVLVLKDLFKVEFTGLNRLIGAPAAYGKNVSDGEQAFERTIDLTIPFRETEQGRAAALKRTSIDDVDVGDLVFDEPANPNKARPLRKSQANTTAEEIDYLPVTQLNTYVQDWTIKVKIAKKYDMRTWKNDRGEGTILNVDLLDSHGGMIQTTFFQDAARKFNEVLQQGRTYSMRGG